MTHAELKAAVLVEMSRRGHLVWNNPIAKARPLFNPGIVIAFGLPGSADILGFLKGGRGVSLEIKTGEGRRTREQRAWHDRCLELGVLSIEVRSLTDLEQVPS